MISKAKFKICRRLGPGVYEKCQTAKFSETTGKTLRRPKPLSEFGAQLVEKQKIRFSYGISEKQLSNYVKSASKIKGAGTAEKFYEELESRLDNVVYRMGLASTRRGARQMVSHGHFIVGGHKVTVPSYKVKVGDLIQVREASKTKKVFENLNEKMKEYKAPNWLSFDPAKMEGKIIGKPINSETFLDLNSVLQFYSR